MTLWMAVEDEPDIYSLVLHMYTSMNVDGLFFTNGEEAIQWVDGVDDNEYDGELPELALLDIRLPGKVNGAMIGKRIRSSPRLKNMTLVLMTAYKLSELQVEALMNMAQADLFLVKPLPKFDELNRILREARKKRN